MPKCWSSSGTLAALSPTQGTCAFDCWLSFYSLPCVCGEDKNGIGIWQIAVKFQIFPALDLGTLVPLLGPSICGPRFRFYAHESHRRLLAAICPFRFGAGAASCFDASSRVWSLEIQALPSKSMGQAVNRLGVLPRLPKPAFEHFSKRRCCFLFWFMLSFGPKSRRQVTSGVVV